MEGVSQSPNGRFCSLKSWMVKFDTLMEGEIPEGKVSGNVCKEFFLK